MDNQNKNDTDKAIIKLGNIFKIFALIATILIIALAVYLFSNAEPKQSSLELTACSLHLPLIEVLKADSCKLKAIL